MDREQLRAAQRPLKDRYRDEPEAALVTLHAEGSLDDQEVACSVQTGRELVRAGLHAATGGSGMLACSGDMLLEALVACAGVTLRAVATSLEIPVTGSVRAEGDLDFRGTLGVAGDGDAPVGFRAIRLIPPRLPTLSAISSRSSRCRRAGSGAAAARRAGLQTKRGLGGAPGQAFPWATWSSDT